MSAISVPSTGLLLCAWALLAAGPAFAEENAWFEKVIGAGRATAISESGLTNDQPTRKRLVAFTKRPAPEKSPETLPEPASSEPRSASLTGSGITWQAASSCAPAALRSVLADLVGNFGPVVVTSTCRGRTQNRAAGGADHSYHLTGEAVDFRVSGSSGAVQAFLSASGKVGGFKHYGGGLYHIDTGPRRSW
jgi:Peptidase M15